MSVLSFRHVGSGIELRSSGLATSVSTYWAILPPLSHTFKTKCQSVPLAGLKLILQTNLVLNLQDLPVSALWVLGLETCVITAGKMKWLFLSNCDPVFIYKAYCFEAWSSVALSKLTLCTATTTLFPARSRHPAKKLLALITHSLLLDLGNHSSILFPRVWLHYLKCLIQYFLFCVWLISVSISLRFTHFIG